MKTKIMIVALCAFTLGGCATYFERWADAGPCESGLKAARDARNAARTPEEIARAEQMRSDAARRCNWLP